ncbi:Methyl-CpG-binding domain protein 4 [Quillaja saponaria]|uniref:Methyl-CpG-binding domain protein 4 n=1 Tax=Quillaja saponaria TaxID=32244 RepID=A0AAD7L3M3_QUISA|nr:Methyl-CpG-binding domain protein 4 [Quillaja saponaria]
MEKTIQSLGLQKTRAIMIQRLSQDYLDDRWTHVTQLHGVGKYALALENGQGETARSYAKLLLGLPLQDQA